jgi:hypothetical protein
MQGTLFKMYHKENIRHEQSKASTLEELIDKRERNEQAIQL